MDCVPPALSAPRSARRRAPARRPRARVQAPPPPSPFSYAYPYRTSPPSPPAHVASGNQDAPRHPAKPGRGGGKGHGGGRAGGRWWSWALVEEARAGEVGGRAGPTAGECPTRARNSRSAQRTSARRARTSSAPSAPSRSAPAKYSEGEYLSRAQKVSRSKVRARARRSREREAQRGGGHLSPSHFLYPTGESRPYRSPYASPYRTPPQAWGGNSSNRCVSAQAAHVSSRGLPPPPPRTKWTRRVPHPVLIGHAASLSQVAALHRARRPHRTFDPALQRASRHRQRGRRERRRGVVAAGAKPRELRQNLTTPPPKRARRA